MKKSRFVLSKEDKKLIKEAMDKCCFFHSTIETIKTIGQKMKEDRCEEFTFNEKQVMHELINVIQPQESDEEHVIEHPGETLLGGYIKTEKEINEKLMDILGEMEFKIFEKYKENHKESQIVKAISDCYYEIASKNEKYNDVFDCGAN